MNQPIVVTADDLLGSGPAAAPAPSSAEPPPPPPPPVDAPPASPAAPEGNPFAGERDKLGREFHPAKFRLKDGKPHVDSRGWFVPQGLGRSSGPSVASGASEGPKAPASFIPPDAPAQLEPVAADMAADVAIGLVQSALIMIGEEEGALTEPEAKMMRGPLQRIIRKYNIGDQLTPELEFAGALAVVIMARMKRPKTHGWFRARLLDVSNWWNRRKLGRVAAPAPASPPTPGPEAAAEYLRRHEN